MISGSECTRMQNWYSFLLLIYSEMLEWTIIFNRIIGRTWRQPNYPNPTRSQTGKPEEFDFGPQPHMVSLWGQSLYCSGWGHSQLGSLSAHCFRQPLYNGIDDMMMNHVLHAELYKQARGMRIFLSCISMEDLAGHIVDKY